jgi:ABC-type thiamine transport system substrate-binding protein
MYTNFENQQALSNQSERPDYNDGQLIEPEKAELITLPNPLEAPEWALYMQDSNKKRESMIDWWSQRQNPDGQIGGGWNDDTLFLRALSDLALSGDSDVRVLSRTSVLQSGSQRKIFLILMLLAYQFLL